MKWNVAVLSIAFAVMIAVSASAGPLVTDGLSFYYSFDAVTGDGGTVADGSGNGYDGDIVGNVTQTTGVVGGAAQFWTEGVDIPDFAVSNKEDASWNRVELPVDDILNGGDIPTSGFTMALWYKTKGFLDADPNYNADQATLCPRSSDASSTWLLHAEIRGRNDASEDYYRFTARGDGMTTIDNIEAGRYDANEGPNWDEWTHLAMTYNKSTGTMKVYENGSLIGSDSTLTANVGMCDDWGLGAWIGCNVDLARQFIGAMDEFYVFNRELTVSEINTLIEGPAPGDANCDGKVDGSDVTILAGNWQAGVSDGQLATWEMGDFNGDNKVDGSDVTILAGNWQHGVTAVASAVPEPGTIVLLLEQHRWTACGSTS